MHLASCRCATTPSTPPGCAHIENASSHHELPSSPQDARCILGGLSSEEELTNRDWVHTFFFSIQALEGFEDRGGVTVGHDHTKASKVDTVNDSEDEEFNQMRSVPRRAVPLLSDLGTYESVRTRIWSWLSDKSP